jgi:hypothetical protein
MAFTQNFLQAPAGATTKVGADGVSYNVTEYHSNSTNDIIYIQSTGIQII